MINELLLLSGNDIPFLEANLVIHQPTIKEIAYIGEECFYTGCEFLRFSKNNLDEKDRIHLEDQTDFDILMSIIQTKGNVQIDKNRTCALMVLGLIFPLHSVTFEKNKIILNNQKEECIIDNKNFNQFREILNDIFCLIIDGEDSTKYNPTGDLAKRIADKLNKRHQRLAELQGENHKVAILSRYISILTIGQQKDMNSFMNYTVYQLFDEFNRYELKLNYDVYLQAKLAGAQDLKEVDDWMKDIHS